MKLSEIAAIRLVNHQLSNPGFSSPKEIVAWMGAMQAQDYPMAKWAVGVRLPGTTDATIDKAIDKAEIIRTHLLRPTWHFVSPDDIHWLLELTAPQIKGGQSARDRQLGLTEDIYSKSNAIIEKALDKGIHLTREELVAELNKVNISTDQNRASHLLMRAEIEGIICSGATHNGKQTYALLSERVPRFRKLTPEEALYELARRYFRSRYPATIQDFTWWSGLSVGKARQALDSVAQEFGPEEFMDLTYWIPDGFSGSLAEKTSAHLLPAYDEFMLSYANRTASILPEYADYMKSISDRGIFRPILVINGQVHGTWKRTIKKDRVFLEISLFSNINRQAKALLDESAKRYGTFMEKSVDVKYTVD